jgi:phage head maturation protease
MRFKADELNPDREMYSFTAPDANGLDQYAPRAMSTEPGLEGYLVPYYVLSDRGTFFVPGSFKKTAEERLKKAPHLYQHYGPMIGTHLAADAKDAKGFRIAVAINEDIHEGAEVMSNHRFAASRGNQAYQFSVGVDRVQWRNGEEKDDAKLDRSYAPAYLQAIPITELVAYTEAKWWESSTVTFAGIGNAQPDIIHTKAPAIIAGWIEDLKKGSMDDSLGREIGQLVAVYQETKGAEPSPGDTHSAETVVTPQTRRADVMAALAKYAGLTVQGYATP